jgi:phenylacetate 2-hydroxylase
MLLESQSLFFVVAAVAVLALRWYFTRADMPKIKNIPEVPGVPIFGSLLQLGDSHTQKAKQWAKEYGAVFQTRLGNRRIVFVNTYDSIKHFWISNQSAMMSRPLFHTFHSALSGDEGYTIGTSPWSESCKQRRKAAAIAMNRPAVQSYMPIIDLESTGSIKEMLQDIQAGDGDINPDGYFQRFALNSSLTLNYGIRIDAKKDNALLKEVIDVEREISLARSNSNNWQDYVPLLRLWPGKAQESQKVQARRVNYMNYFLNELKARIANGTDKPCITGNVLKDPEARLNDGKLHV